MLLEDQNTERKSLRKVLGKGADWDGLARICVSFANGTGGHLLIGIEDGEALPPVGQQLPPDLMNRIRRRIAELTVNVRILPSSQQATNGAEYIELVVPHSPNVVNLVHLAGFSIKLRGGGRPLPSSGACL